MGETKGSTSRKPTVPLLQFAFGTCQLQVLSCVFLLVICRAGNKLGDPLARPATPRDSSLESRFVWDPGQDQQKDCGWLAPSFTGWGADCFKKFQSHVPQGLFFQSPLSGVWQEEEGIWSCSERWQWQCAPQFLKHPGTSWDVAMLTKLQWFLHQSSYFHSDQPVPNLAVEESDIGPLHIWTPARSKRMKQANLIEFTQNHVPNASFILHYLEGDFVCHSIRSHIYCNILILTDYLGHPSRGKLQYGLRASKQIGCYRTAVSTFLFLMVPLLNLKVLSQL